MNVWVCLHSLTASFIWSLLKQQWTNNMMQMVLNPPAGLFTCLAKHAHQLSALHSGWAASHSFRWTEHFSNIQTWLTFIATFTNTTFHLKLNPFPVMCGGFQLSSALLLAAGSSCWEMTSLHDHVHLISVDLSVKLDVEKIKFYNTAGTLRTEFTACEYYLYKMYKYLYLQGLNGQTACFTPISFSSYLVRSEICCRSRAATHLLSAAYQKRCWHVIKIKNPARAAEAPLALPLRIDWSPFTSLVPPALGTKQGSSWSLHVQLPVLFQDNQNQARHLSLDSAAIPHARTHSDPLLHI